MKSLTIVSHCYSPPGCDLYLQHLKWQLSSLFNHDHDCHVTYMLFHDGSASDMLSCVPPLLTKLCMIPWLFPPEMLLRRAIGRNIAARDTQSDVIWFADLDYCFGEGCIDSVMRQVDVGDGLRFPRRVMENIDQATGERMIDDNRNVKWPMIDSSLFKSRRRQFAIGGLQIVGGNWARENGYLGGTKWTRPVSPDKGWRQTGEDVPFRRCFESSKAIDVDNLYWIRHDTKGADMDGQGTVLGKKVW